MTRQHDRLVRLADLDERHTGKTIMVNETTAVLAGVIPVGDRVQLNLILGGQHCWTAAYPAETHVLVHHEAPDTADLCSRCAADKHERALCDTGTCSCGCARAVES